MPHWVTYFPKRYTERGAVVVIGALAFTIGYLTQHWLQSVYFYQTWAPETVLFACGRGFTWPAQTPDSLINFLTLKAVAFDCRDLDGIETLPSRPFLWSSPWLYLSTALSWKFFGVTQAALAPLTGVFHAAYAIGAFVLARLYFPLWAAALVGAAITLSPVAISLLLLLRDYSKAPFIIWGIVAIVCLLRTRGTWVAPGYAFLLGAVLAVGSGFRQDVWVLGPITVLVLLIAIASGRQPIVLRIAVFMAFTTPVVLGFTPQFIHPFPAPLSSVALQGTTMPFDRNLKLATAGYDLGHRYSDELTMSAMVVDIGNKRFVDSGELRGQELSRLANAASLKAYILNFPADIAMRAIKATVLTVGFYPLLKTESLATDPGRPPYPIGYRLPAIGAAAIDRLTFAAMPLLLIPGLLFLFAGTYARSPAEAFVMVLIVLSLAASMSVQFSTRHFFHLEWLPWFGLLGYLYFPQMWTKRRGLLFWNAGMVVAILTVVTIFWWGLSIYQSNRLINSITALVTGAREVIPIDFQTETDGLVQLSIPVPEQHRLIIESAPDYLSDFGPLRPPPSDMRIVAAADRLVLRVGGTTCRDRSVRIATVYRRQPTAWQDLGREIEVRTPIDPGMHTTVLLPVFYRPTQWLAALRVMSGPASCITSVERLTATTPLPTLFSAVLEPGWRERTLALGFGRL